jgi:hypothetical protein
MAGVGGYIYIIYIYYIVYLIWTKTGGFLINLLLRTRLGWRGRSLGLCWRSKKMMTCCGLGTRAATTSQRLRKRLLHHGSGAAVIFPLDPFGVLSKHFERLGNLIGP